MYISQILIEEFGALRNKTLTLDPAFNLLTGANESGKSTLCAFIKYVFYGFTSQKEKERHSSLTTGNSSGSIILVSADKQYRVERRDSGRIHRVTVYDETTGEEFEDWKSEALTPGDFFLGVSPELYSRSIYVSQESGAHLDGGSAEAISNLLLSGDEAVNLKRAEKSLDAARKALKLKKGSGGRIYESEQRIAQLKDRLHRGLQTKRELEKLTLDLEQAEKDVSEIEALLFEAKSSLEKIKFSKIKLYLSEYEKAKNALNKNEILTEALNREYTRADFLPDSKYAKKLESAEREIAIYSEQCLHLQNQINKAKRELSITPPKGYEAYCELGRTDGVLTEFKKHHSSVNSLNILRFSSYVLIAVTLIALVASFFKLYSASNTLLFTILGISAFGALISNLLVIRPKKKLKALLSSLDANNKRTPTDVCRECEAYEAKLGNQSRYLIDTLNETKHRIELLKSEEATLLKKWGCRSVSEALEQYSRYSERLAELKSSKEKEEKNVSVLNAYVSTFDEHDVEKARKMSDVEPITPEMADINEDYVRKLEIRYTEASRHKNELRLELASKGVDRVDIERLVCDIESEERQLKEYSEKFDAIILAQKSLEAAEMNIRKTVSPYLSKNSSEYFSRITGGRYPELRLDGEMNLSYLGSGASDVTDSVYLSGGSADLAWLCLRLALHKRLSQNISVPLILDECLVYFDDTRLKLILSELYEIAARGIQILLFSASSREKERLNKKASVLELK